jgi:hypothetical protein
MSENTAFTVTFGLMIGFFVVIVLVMASLAQGPDGSCPKDLQQQRYQTAIVSNSRAQIEQDLARANRVIEDLRGESEQHFLALGCVKENGKLNWSGCLAKVKEKLAGSEKPKEAKDAK